MNPRMQRKNLGSPEHILLKSGGMGEDKWIQKMHMKKGALHRALGVPSDEDIPVKKLQAAEHSQSPLMRKRANLAMTLRSFNK